MNFIPEDFISSKWLLRTEGEKSRLLNRLYINNYKRKTSNSNNIDKDDRYRILLSEFKQIAHLGSLSCENFVNVRCNLNELMNSMQRCGLTEIEKGIYISKIDVLNPKMAKTKGRKPQRRNKGVGETSN